MWSLPSSVRKFNLQFDPRAGNAFEWRNHGNEKHIWERIEKAPMLEEWNLTIEPTGRGPISLSTLPFKKAHLLKELSRRHFQHCTNSGTCYRIALFLVTGHGSLNNHSCRPGGQLGAFRRNDEHQTDCFRISFHKLGVSPVVAAKHRRAVRSARRP
jgi:hypothetical protein